MLIAMCVLFVVIFTAGCGFSAPEQSQNENKLQNVDVSKVPDDGRVHVIYTDSFGTKLKVKVIHIGDSYTSHVIWLETERGSIYESSVSTH